MPKRLVAVVLLAFVVSTYASAEPASPPLPPDNQIIQMLATRVDKQRQATGIVIGIVEPAGNRIVTYGRMGINDNRRMDGDTVFDIGSVTKVVTALLLAEMAERGEVKLDDPVQKYLPAGRVKMPAFEGRQITLADLATHTSGLPLRPTNLSSSDLDNKYAGYTLDALYAFLSGYKLTRAPGSGYEYSNVGYGLIGPALATRGGKSWAELVRTRIAEPLGMRDTSVELSDAMKARLALGYNTDLTPAKHWDMAALESAGALRSTTNDLMKLLRAALGLAPSPLAPALQLTAKTRRPGGMQPANEIALGWNVYRVDGREIVWKNGNVGGFRTFVGYDAKARRGIVAFANAQTANGADDIALHLLDPSYHVDTHIPRTHTEIALSPKVLDQYVGRYRFTETDIITITREGDHLFCVLAGTPDKLPMFAESERDFFFKVADIQITFDAIVAGRATKATWHQGGQDQVGVRIE
jgi:D-alanyl-D-alanine-carboxypeptidase/D-alanyl-D-alanine-endopeptidase